MDVSLRVRRERAPKVEDDASISEVARSRTMLDSRRASEDGEGGKPTREVLGFFVVRIKNLYPSPLGCTCVSTEKLLTEESCPTSGLIYFSMAASMSQAEGDEEAEKREKVK
ncbi:hypothetical protein KC363_g60 [Hortaea werneckii]|nr:hypothetical protein KC363_g60 [Hortaea werneckii]